jgi:Transposase zinc-binding domain/Putative transposase
VLYAVVRDNLATLYGAVDDGELAIALPKFVRKELDGYLTCGLLCCGFARLWCEGCKASRVVAFSCKGRGFCPSCLGRKMAQTAAHLIDEVLPEVALRQWVLTFPFAWRKRLGYDGALLSALTGIFVKTVLAFYKKHTGRKAAGGAVISVQRTSSDLKLNPHLHAVFLDGAYLPQKSDADAAEDASASESLTFSGLGHLSSREVAGVLATSLKRMAKYLRKRGMLEADVLRASETETEDATEARGHAELLGSAASGALPPAGPSFAVADAVQDEGTALAPKTLQWTTKAPSFDKPLCCAQDGFTLHAATRAGGADRAGREALLKCILRPAVAQDRITHGPAGLVRITLKRAFGDGTRAVDMDLRRRDLGPEAA